MTESTEWEVGHARSGTSVGGRLGGRRRGIDVTARTDDLDLVVEGTATRVTDPATLQRVVDVYIEKQRRARSPNDALAILTTETR
jgi:hypothetical protein